MSKYTVSVTENWPAPEAGGVAASATVNVNVTTEIFRQGFEEGEFNLRQFVRTLNSAPRGRKPKSAKKEAQP